MAEMKAVANPIPDPKIGKPRPRSGVGFPYYDLDKSIDVARIMHDKAGGQCDRAQLAALLKYSGVKNGGFLARVAAAKMFGLLDQQDEMLRVTNRGQAAVAPVSSGDAERAHVEAFMAVDLFKKVFDRFNGQSLPSIAGLTNLLLNEYKVVPDRVAPTLKIMLDSAESAGLFKATGNRSRMVAPVMPAASSETRSHAVPEPGHGFSSNTPSHSKSRGNGSEDGGDGGDRSIPPAILGLVKGLPPAGTPMTQKRREALIGAFTATVGYIYPDKDEEA